ITVSLGSQTDTASVTITKAVLASIGVTPAAVKLPIGLVQSYSATGIYSDATKQDLTTQVTWSSSDDTVISISNATGTEGDATALALGDVTITASLGSMSGSTTASAVAATVVSIALSPDKASVPAGESQAFSATGTYSDGSQGDVTDVVTWT